MPDKRFEPAVSGLDSAVGILAAKQLCCCNDVAIVIFDYRSDLGEEEV